MSDSIILPQSEDRTIPVVAIIGRPNVGKSTLFNRLVGKRRAITDPTPGVTRDPIPERWLLGNHPVTLIDSGGVKMEQEGLDSLVSEKSLSLLEKADAIVFLMECTGVTAEDLMLAERLRPYSDKLVLVVNKVDDDTRDSLVWDYFSYGFQRVVGISAAHGLGIEELEDTLLGMLDLVELDEAPEEDHRVKLAIMGKPNTGKSTLTNYLTGSDISIVSDIPGTTRDVVQGGFSYKGSDFTVLDTAGIRRKSKVDEDVEYYSVNRAIKTIDICDVVLLMIDSVEGLSEQDKKIASLIVRRGKGVVLVLNKIDLLRGVGNELEAIKDRVRFLFPVLSFAPLVDISALEGKNIGKLLDTVWAVWRQLNKRTDTAQLNNALRTWVEAYQPPRGTTGHFKVYYGTQVSVAPVRFLFFVNRIKAFPAVYIQYLKNCIRRDLGFTLIPIEVDLRERRRNPSLHTTSRSEFLADDAKAEDGAETRDHKPLRPRKEQSAVSKNVSEKAKTQKNNQKSGFKAIGKSAVKPGAAPGGSTQRTGGKAKAAPKQTKPGNKAAKGKAEERAKSQERSRKGRAR
ncbi:MAG: ribosome biogenesis GTPase Der [Sphaerochaetaceae bacterium]|nr:ribosome biogenesis GTPase Der [Sphaerochaetaceae bacterium]